MKQISGESSGGTKPYNNINMPTNPSDKTTKWGFQDGGANRMTDNIKTMNI